MIIYRDDVLFKGEGHRLEDIFTVVNRKGGSGEMRRPSYIL